MKKLRIAVWHNLPSGGGKRQLYNHVKGLSERGHHVESWCPDTAGQDYLPLGGMINEHVLPLKIPRPFINSSIRPLITVRKMLSCIEDHCKICADQMHKGGFDVLYANACMYLRTTPIAKFVNLPSAIYLGEPYRWFYEAMPELPWIARKNLSDMEMSLASIRDGLFRRLSLNGVRVQARAELEYAKKFDLILANSIFSRETILRTYNLESKVCYLGVDSDYYRPTDEEKERYVVGLGTIYHVKGIDRAVQAVGSMEKHKRPDLVWIGNGASKKELRNYTTLANKLGVHFVPKINIPDNEVVKLLGRALAMIYTSRLEPFGLAPLEANACGTPVVGIAEGGVKETVQDNINGFLATDDDPEILGSLIRRFVDDIDLSASMGKQAREHVVRNWSMEASTDNIESYLYKLVSRVHKK